MGFTYLGGKSWLEVSREERLFCAHLYHDIRSGGLEQESVDWLKEDKEGRWQNAEARKALGVDGPWEIGYEVCFYRDLLNSRNKQVRETDYFDKRTFDLCLFSEETIVIIEAKVHEGFDSAQMSHLTTYTDEQGRERDGDKQLVQKLVANGSGPSVFTVALASNEYLKRRHKGDRDVLRPPRVDAIISWNDVDQWARTVVKGYSNVDSGIYLKADGTYESSAARKRRMSSN